MRDYEDLRSDQQSCIDELYGNDRAYAVMRMGGGKTATCLTTIAELIADGHRRRAIVMAPPLVAATVWPNEPAKWAHLKHLKVEPLIGGPKKREKLLRESDADVLTVSDGVVGWLVEQLKALPDDHPLLDVFAYDEPKLKSPRGTIGKALIEVAPRLKSIWLFSGTPRPNGYEDLFMPARVLKPGMWSDDFDEWRRRNFMPMDFHGYTWEVHDFRARELDRDIQTFMVRAAEPKGARHGTLTSGAEHDFEIDLPEEAAKKYREMERDLLVEVIGDQDPDDPAVIAALSQAVASSKLAQIAQGFVYDKPEDGEEKIAHTIHTAKQEVLRYQLDAIGAENTVICYGFQEDLLRIEELLKKDKRSYGVLGAGRSIKQKMRDVERWNEGRLDNLILHPASAGHGVELQFGGRRMIWYCPTWSAEQYDQTIKRLDRPGQELQVYSHQIIARDTVDIVKRNRVEFKMRDQDAFKDMLRTL
jgi:SNF2 family DNA or RNA helicase